MFPKAENVSYMALLSILLSKFLMNTLPTPDFLNDGSLWDHIILIGRPLSISKFIVSKARSAAYIYIHKKKDKKLLHIKYIVYKKLIRNES